MVFPVPLFSIQSIRSNGANRIVAIYRNYRQRTVDKIKEQNTFHEYLIERRVDHAK